MSSINFVMLKTQYFCLFTVRLLAQGSQSTKKITKYSKFLLGF